MPDSKADKPSFTTFWKRSKNKEAGQSLTFVSSKLGQSSAHGGDDGQTEPSAEAKAKERRQQVRKAQRQHRQRKANYTKQLEMDITKLRDDIEMVEQEVKRLKSQNGAIRSQLAGGGGGGGGGGRGGGQMALPTTSVDEPQPQPQPMLGTMGPAFSTFLAPNYTVSLDVSEYLGTPAYQVRRATSSVPESGSSKTPTSSRAAETFGSATPASSTAVTSLEDVAMMEAALSEEHIDRVINFILALEHCCWNHIDHTCFDHHTQHCSLSQSPEKPCPRAQAEEAQAVTDATGEEIDDEEAEDEEEGALNGHAMMATSLALQSAPMDVFTQMQATTTTAGHDHDGVAAAAVEWPSRTLTLTNLRRLARSLNPSDSELAPVQVWFELASLYGVAVATDADVLSGLRAALGREVHCVQFGAAVQRDVFESAVREVIGFLPRSWRGDEEEEEGGEEIGE